MTISSTKSISGYGYDVSNLRTLKEQLYDKLHKEGKIFDGDELSTIPVSKDMKMIGIEFRSGGFVGFIAPELKHWPKRIPFKGKLVSSESGPVYPDKMDKIVYLFDVSSPLNRSGDKFTINFEGGLAGKTKKINKTLIY